MLYTELPGRFEAVQWTGGDHTAVTGLYDTAMGMPDAIWRVNDEGVLEQDPYGGAAGPMWRPVIGAGCWVVVGPYWNGSPTPGTLAQVVEDSVFAARFQVAP